MNKKAKIKYDRFDSRLYFVLACLFTAWALTDILLVIFDRLIEHAPSIIVVLTVGTTPFTPILALLCWIIYIDVRLYFANLKKFGYSIPEKKKDHGSIDELIVGDVMQPQQKARSVGSVLTAAAAALSGICQIGYIIYIVLRFTADPHSDLIEIIIMSVVAFISVLIFALMSYIFFRESDNSRFRDEIERGGLPNRVPRVDFIKGLAIVFLWSMVTFGADEIILNMLKYISRSRAM